MKSDMCSDWKQGPVGKNPGTADFRGVVKKSLEVPVLWATPPSKVGKRNVSKPLENGIWRRLGLPNFTQKRRDYVGGSL